MMRTATLAACVLATCVLRSSPARADVVFRDPNLHCPRGAIVEPTHGPSYCMALACTTGVDCRPSAFDDGVPGDCVPLGVCIVSETIPGGFHAPPGTTYLRETAVASCDAATPCATGTCRLGSYCVAHGTAPSAPPLPPIPPVSTPVVPPSTALPDASSIGPAAMMGGFAGVCGGAVAGSVVALIVALVVGRRARK